MNKKFMLFLTLGCLSIVIGITAWIISINDTYSVENDEIIGIYKITLIATDGIITDGKENYGSSLEVEKEITVHDDRFTPAGTYFALKEGYIFNGWSFYDGCEAGYKEGDEPFPYLYNKYYACFYDSDTPIKYMTGIWKEKEVSIEKNSGDDISLHSHSVYEDPIIYLEYQSQVNLSLLHVTKESDNMCSNYKLIYWKNLHTKKEITILDSSSDRQWIEPIFECDDNYTVTLIATGGTITDGTKEHGSTFKIEEIKKFNYGDYTADKDGYKFTGWGVSGCTTGTLTGEENLTSNTTYHACFTEITSTTTKYKVTFNANGGKFSNGENIQTVEYDEKYLLENLTVSKTDTSCSSGYELEGWNDGSKILTSYVDSAEDGKTLTAKWGSCKTSTTDPEPTDPDPTPTDPDPTPTPGETETHNVTLNANGGTIKGENKEIISINNISTFDYSSYTAKKDGITFNGWGTTTSCTEGKLKDEIELKKICTLWLVTKILLIFILIQMSTNYVL